MHLSIPARPKSNGELHLYLLRVFGPDGVYVRMEQLFWAENDAAAGRFVASAIGDEDVEDYSITRYHE